MSPSLEEMSLEELWQLFPARKFSTRTSDRPSYSYWLNIDRDYLGQANSGYLIGNS